MSITINPKKYIDRKIDERVAEVVGNKYNIQYRKDVSDTDATKEISSFLSAKRKEGVEQISTFDVSTTLGLPATQVNKVLEDFAKRRQVKPVEV